MYKNMHFSTTGIMKVTLPRMKLKRIKWKGMDVTITQSIIGEENRTILHRGDPLDSRKQTIHFQLWYIHHNANYWSLL